MTSQMFILVILIRVAKNVFDYIFPTKDNVLIMFGP